MKYFAILLIQSSSIIYSCFMDQHSGIDSSKNKTLIAFGSCSRQNIPNQRWNDVLQHEPDIWIWLGDNIYGDTHDMNIMKEKYKQQKAYPGYQELLHSSTKIIGTWDDHDYGVNDGGKNYSRKDESKKLMLEFLNVSKDNPVLDREGVYQSYEYDFKNYKLKVILLDTRYFRDTIYKEPDTRAYLPNTNGDVLGEKQWNWLEKELKDSGADLHIIGSSIQVISEEHAYEKWGNFPEARNRLFDLLKKFPNKKVILISGDRHIAEISKMDIDGLNYPLYDFTSSGLTHTWRNVGNEPNQYRISDFIISLNFGLILIEWNENGKHTVQFEIRGEGNELLYGFDTEL